MTKEKILFDELQNDVARECKLCVDNLITKDELGEELFYLVCRYKYRTMKTS